MIQFKVQELSKGFDLVEYFDDRQPSEMDSDHTYCESWDALIKTLEKKVQATIESRSAE